MQALLRRVASGGATASMRHAASRMQQPARAAVRPAAPRRRYADASSTKAVLETPYGAARFWRQNRRCLHGAACLPCYTSTHMQQLTNAATALPRNKTAPADTTTSDAQPPSRVYVDWAVYKSKGAMTVKFIKPTWNAANSPGGGFKVDRWVARFFMGGGALRLLLRPPWARGCSLRQQQQQQQQQHHHQFVHARASI
jgi:hypothetical protein